ncbi:DUF6802 family protein [Haloechinothrix sp. LS1_15]|uniref:DUF6802 family protein n=1 Tax=Haloechinothrix sp. LS1_15 TaxID=2652248 RepID=UPI002945FD0F|nr:DUF6802 family protein [Haloechinothrix sp. LS1_15]MDV6011043.1 hypothetical protein [Haloechinothrix sp. LS1_15]
MYIDESGGTDDLVTEKEMTVDVDGDEYTAEMNLDSSGDGAYDTVLIREEDGSARAFVDTDGSGRADEYIALDDRGRPVTVAGYEESTGRWVADEPAGSNQAAQGADAAAAGPMTAEFPDGPVDVGPPTVDTNHDGTPDTAVVERDGATYYFTDTTGDGEADVAVVMSSGGTVTTVEHTGDGRWQEVERTADGPGSGDGQSMAGDTGEDLAGATGSGGVATVDPATGQWITS